MSNNMKNPKIRIIKLIIWVCIIVYVMNFITNRLKKKPIEFVSPIKKIPVSSNQPQKQEQTNSKSLKEAVNTSLTDAKGTYAVAVKNLKTGENYFLDAHKIFEPGSLYKLWVMSTVIGQIESGKIVGDEILTDSIKQLNKDYNIDPESAELTNGTITLSVKDALNQMITISHNYAAMLLTKKVKLNSIEDFIVKNGFNESMVGESPKTTSYDIALFFEKLYKGQLANTENTSKMIELLKKQTLNNKLPKYLPGKTSIAHKTGEIDFLSHDAGIIFSEKGDYIIVILSESDSPKGAEERIAQISAAVFNYFNGR